METCPLMYQETSSLGIAGTGYILGSLVSLKVVEETGRVTEWPRLSLLDRQLKSLVQVGTGSMTPWVPLSNGYPWGRSCVLMEK